MSRTVFAMSTLSCIVFLLTAFFMSYRDERSDTAPPQLARSPINSPQKVNSPMKPSGEHSIHSGQPSSAMTPTHSGRHQVHRGTSSVGSSGPSGAG